MWNRLSILFITLAATSFATALTEQFPSSINDVIQSDQFMFVAQQDRFRFEEVNVYRGECPKVVTNPQSTIFSFRLVGVHLMRDLNGIQPPKFMVVEENRYIRRIQVFPLNVSEALKENTHNVLEHLSKMPAGYFENPSAIRKSDQTDAAHSVFDSKTHMLYFDSSNKTHFAVDKYYVTEDLSEVPQIVLVGSRAGPSDKRKYNLVEDPYTNLFYYKEDGDKQAQYFEAKIDDVFDVLSGNLSGRSVNMLSMYDELIGVSKGTYFGLRGTNKTDFSFLASGKSQLRFDCKIEIGFKDRPKNNKIVIVRDNDYCMVRDGANYNEEKCNKERNHSLDTIENEEFNILIWLIIFCVILLVIIILQCVYVYWLRTSFITVDDQIAQNEQETEASLFIAKQRSFPTSYQDPALLDISVDKWN